MTDMVQTISEWDSSKNRLMICQVEAMKALRQLPDGCADLVITDPPYESLEKHRRIGTTTRLKVSDGSSNEWFKIFPNKKFPRLLRELYRVMSANSHLYIMCDDETSNVLWDANLALDGGKPLFKYWKRIVWDKQRIGMGYHWRAQYEFALFFEKGKRKLNELGWPDIITVPRVNPKGAYPGEKPSELFRKMVMNSTRKGEVVLDPFCGSGSSGVAAIGTGRRYIGFDISERAISLSVERVTGAL